MALRHAGRDVRKYAPAGACQVLHGVKAVWILLVREYVRRQSDFGGSVKYQCVKI